VTSEQTPRLFGPGARVIVVLALVHFPWPGLGSWFAGYFSHAATWLLAPLTAHGRHVELLAAPSPGWSVFVDASDLLTQRVARAALDVRRVGWLPLGAFTALLLAFPTRHWQRRLAVAGIGLSILHLLWVLPVLATFGVPGLGFFELGRVGYTLAVIGQRALITLPGMAYAVSALLWFLLTWSLERELM
jgi:hypothetical protein